MEPINKAMLQLWYQSYVAGNATAGGIDKCLDDTQAAIKKAAVDDRVKAERAAYDKDLAEKAAQIVHTEATKEYLEGLEKRIDRVVASNKKEAAKRKKTGRSLKEVFGIMPRYVMIASAVRADLLNYCNDFLRVMTPEDEATLVHSSHFHIGNPRGIVRIKFPPHYDTLGCRPYIADVAENYFEPFVDNTDEYLKGYLLRLAAALRKPLS